MAFFGLEFIFDGIPSSNYGLVIASIDGGGVIESPQGSSISVLTKKILRNPKEFIFGVEQTPVLEFDIEFLSENPLSAQERSIIGSWLFGQQQYKQLSILQPDMQSVYFNCIITNATVIFIGRLAYGWKAHIRCDSPFAWETPLSVVKSYPDSVLITDAFNFMNTSHDNYYTFPTLVFTMSSLGSTLSITNDSDNSRNFVFTGLSASETIVIDNSKQTMTSSLGLKRIGKFNLKWLRLVPGMNKITIIGGITYLNMTVPIARKIGG